MHRKGFLLAAEQVVVLARASTWELHSQRSWHHLKRSNIFSSILCNFYLILDFHQTISHRYSLVLYCKTLFKLCLMIVRKYCAVNGMCIVYVHVQRGPGDIF